MVWKIRSDCSKRYRIVWESILRKISIPCTTRYHILLGSKYYSIHQTTIIQKNSKQFRDIMYHLYTPTSASLKSIVGLKKMIGVEVYWRITTTTLEKAMVIAFEIQYCKDHNWQFHVGRLLNARQNGRVEAFYNQAITLLKDLPADNYTNEQKLDIHLSQLNPTSKEKWNTKGQQV